MYPSENIPVGIRGPHTAEPGHASRLKLINGMIVLTCVIGIPTVIANSMNSLIFPTNINRDIVYSLRFN